MKNTTLFDRNFSDFTQKLQQLDWSWIKDSQAFQRYQATLFLLWKYRTQIVPEKQVDMILHEHIDRSSFVEDMKLLFGATLIHEPGIFAAAGQLTRNLFEQEFYPIADWEMADCGMLLTV